MHPLLDIAIYKKTCIPQVFLSHKLIIFKTPKYI